MSPLPIDDILEDLFLALTNHTQIMLKAPPGAGKSTRIPMVLLEREFFSGKIILLEPRRLAAKNIAGFLAKQRGEQIGETVGLRIRGETRVSDKTRLEIVTEGVLTRMIQSDPELTGIDLVIFDEFHERSLHADLALALSLDVQSGLRDSLRILLMSATLNQHPLSHLLPDMESLESTGFSFPVDVRYQAIARHINKEAAIVSAIIGLVEQESGSALVFLPGVAEIKRVTAGLSKRLSSDILLCPLYGKLTSKEQQDAISPAPLGKRKVVLATNIAETSLTIEGISLVVDSGVERVARFNRKNGITKLETVQISCSSAVQRMGRAGRLSNGICLRLYSEETFQRMQPMPEPQILNSDLMQLVFDVVQWGCDCKNMHWIDTPPTLHWQQAVNLLKLLGILNEKEGLTPKGKRIAEHGVDARLGAMLFVGASLGNNVFSLACWLAALTEDPPQIRESDLTRQLSLICAQKGTHLQRATQLAAKWNIPLSVDLEWSYLGILAAAAWPDRIAKSRGSQGRFLLSNGHGAVLDVEHPLSASKGLVAVDLMSVSVGDSRIFTGCELDFLQLQREMPSLFSHRDWIGWDDKKGALIAERQCCVGEIVVNRKPITDINETMRIQALLLAVKRKGLNCLRFSERSHRLMIRAQCAIEMGLPLCIPAMDERSLLNELEEWLAPFMLNCTDMNSLQQVDTYSALKARLGWSTVNALDNQLPEKFQVTSGAHYSIRYQVNQKPMLSVKMQEMYGQTSSPCIANGKVKLVVELLSPALRPLQVTQDLAGFWQGAYRDVQKEMKGRYPKHIWPDDPANHYPTTQTKRHFKPKG